MKAVKTLVLLVNDKDARILENDGVGKGLHQVAHIERDTALGAEIAYADGPGRSKGGSGGAHHGMEPSTSEDRQNRERFAGHVLGETEALWTKGGFERLIVAAPAKMLGELRDRMPPVLAGGLQGDLAKDLLHTPVVELPGHFEGMAAF